MVKLLKSCSALRYHKKAKVGPSEDLIESPSICLNQLSLYIKFMRGIKHKLFKIFDFIEGIAFLSLLVDLQYNFIL